MEPITRAGVVDEQSRTEDEEPKGLLHQALHWALLQFLDDDDPWHMTARKIITTIAPFTSCSVPLAFGIYSAITFARRDDNASFSGELLVALALFAYCAFVTVPMYVQMRRIGEVTDGMAAWLTFATHATAAICSAANLGFAGVAAHIVVMGLGYGLKLHPVFNVAQVTVHCLRHTSQRLARHLLRAELRWIHGSRARARARFDQRDGVLAARGVHGGTRRRLRHAHRQHESRSSRQLLGPSRQRQAGGGDLH
jgi:hypothetical protein